MTRPCRSMHSTARVLWRGSKSRDGVQRYETREWHEGRKYVIEKAPGRWSLFVKTKSGTERIADFSNPQYAKWTVGAWAMIERALNAGRLPK